MNPMALWTIARQELTTNVRNRWTGLFAIAFALLVTGVAAAGVLAEGFSGMQNFTRTSASLLNLVLYIIPLVALVMGTLSFTGDKGSMELLFSQPLSRMGILLGKLLGVFLSIAISTLIGFTVAGGVILSAGGAAGLGRYAAFVLLSLALALVFLCLALLLATANRRKTRTFGVALFLWFFLVLFYDLLVLGGSSMLRGQGATTFLFLSIFGNPVDMVRVATLIILENITIFGAAGAAMMRFLGGSVVSMFLLALGLLVWVSVPLIVVHRMVRGQDI
jgi:Cu-processing system permease protein